MKSFAVFDIDGTLIRWQLYHAVVDKMAKKQLLGPDAQSILHEARMIWKRREHPNAFREYELQLIKLYEDALPHLSAVQFDEVVEEVAQEYKEQVYTFTRQLVFDLKQKGYTLLAISGSHQELVAHIARQFGFDDWLGTDYERIDGAFSGKKFVPSTDKKRALESLIKKHGLALKGSVGVGDSKSDVAFLEMVERAIAFNPDQELYALAKKYGWEIVLERKNVVYNLKSDDGTYVLA